MKRVPFLIVPALLLSGCFGGSVHSIPTTATPQQVVVQHSVATQVLQTQQFSQSIDTLGAGGHGLVFAQTIRTEAAKLIRHEGAAVRKPQASSTPPPFGPCSNGYETAANAVSPAEEQVYMAEFYDAACTQPYRDTYLDLLSSAGSTMTATFTGNQTQYAKSGSVFVYNTLSGSIDLSAAQAELTIQTSSAPSATAPSVTSNGVSCVLSGAGSATAAPVSCAFGSVAHVQSIGKDFGSVMLLSETNSSATFSNGGYGFVVNGSSTNESGALNALTLAPGSTVPSWSLAGTATAGATASVAGEMDFDAFGIPAGGTVTVTDSADDVVATMTMSSTGSTGTLKKISTGATLATFSTDVNGNGTITYSNGSTGQILNWIAIG